MNTSLQQAQDAPHLSKLVQGSRCKWLSENGGMSDRHEPELTSNGVQIAAHASILALSNEHLRCMRPVKRICSLNN